MGHRRAVYANPLPIRQDWKQRRGSLLRHQARLAGNLDVAVAPTSHQLSRRPITDTLRRGIAGLYARRAPLLAVFDYFLARQGALAPAMEAFGVVPEGSAKVDLVIALARFMALGGGRLASEDLGAAPGASEGTLRKIRMLRSATDLRVDATYAYQISATVHLLQVLGRGHPTALVVPNDQEAVHIYRWLHLAGYRVPEDVSLLSFDNSPGLQPYPIDSVDLGFGHLGYCALHAVLGDIPIRRDQTGNVLQGPRVVQRGSVRYLGR
jgi:hypothetical protein